MTVFLQRRLDLQASLRICFPCREVGIGMKDSMNRSIELAWEGQRLDELRDDLLLIVLDDFSLDIPFAPDLPRQVRDVLRQDPADGVDRLDRRSHTQQET